MTSEPPDLSGEIQAHLMKAMELLIAAEGNLTGNYALIVQATLNPDGTFLMPWQRYYSAPQVRDDSLGPGKTTT